MTTPKIDISGKRYGKLVAVKFAGKDKRFNSMWECACDCGGDKTVSYSHLNSGHVSSCGCSKAEVLRKRNEKHGESKTDLYTRYLGMIARCRDKNHISYRLYGEIGISVCEEWANDFRVFKDWAMENGYEPSLVIDRVDSDGDYAPDNCRWVTRTVNNQNARPRRGVIYRGVKRHKNKFRADIQADKKSTFLGLFDTMEAAAQARNEYIIKNSLPHRVAQIKGA